MAKTQITVKKKKKLTVRSAEAGLNKEEGAAAAEGAAPAVAAVQAVQPAVPAGKPVSYTWAAILALVAVLLFAALILLQVSEFNFLKLAFPV